MPATPHRSYCAWWMGPGQWIARTVACEPAPVPQAAARKADAATPRERAVVAGRVAVDVPPTELRVGDQVVNDGRLATITDLRYRHGGSRIMILAGGRLAVAERTCPVSIHLADNRPPEPGGCNEG
ncbi:hypothetical protein ACIPJK_36935 [Streptomyces roseus]|uniref:hypothetical protein n=1 Tax=Streptomyces roseus TaxID=66430 RepID=UPI0038085892